MFFSYKYKYDIHIYISPQEANRKFNHAELKMRRLNEHRATREKIGEKTILDLKTEAETLEKELSDVYSSSRKSEEDINNKKDMVCFKKRMNVWGIGEF